MTELSLIYVDARRLINTLVSILSPGLFLMPNFPSMKSKAPLKTYGCRHKPYSALSGAVNLLDSVLDDAIARRSRGGSNISTLQESLEKIEEVSCPLEHTPRHQR